MRRIALFAACAALALVLASCGARVSKKNYTIPAGSKITTPSGTVELSKDMPVEEEISAPDAHGRNQIAFEKARKPIVQMLAVKCPKESTTECKGLQISGVRRLTIYQTRPEFFKPFEDERFKYGAQMAVQAGATILGLGAIWGIVEHTKALNNFGSPATAPANVNVSGQGSAVVGSGSISGSPPSGPTTTTTTTTNP